MKQCPACAEMIEDTAARCPFCRSDVAEPSDAGGNPPRSSSGVGAGLLVALALGAVLLMGVVAAVVLLLPGSVRYSDAATYQEIAAIYQQHKSGRGENLSGKLESIVERLAEEAGSTERAKQEMLWGARDYLMPMLESTAWDGPRAEHAFKHHMAVARQQIGDPSLPDLGGSVTDPPVTE